MPEVSIITPTFNRAAWLKECIQSVLMQTDVDWEMLILDNGSAPDSGTAEVLESLKDDPRFKTFHVDENYGPHTPLYSISSGEFITNLCDDDLLLGPDSLSRRVQMLRAHPRAGFVFSPVRGHTADGHDMGELSMGKISNVNIGTNAAPFEKLFIQCFVPFPAGMFRRELIPLAFKPHIGEAGCSADWAFWVEAAWNGWDQCYLASPTVSLRQHQGQATYTMGVDQGGFFKANLSVWKHYIELGHRPTNRDLADMRAIQSKLIQIQSQRSLDDSDAQINALLEANSSAYSR